MGVVTSMGLLLDTHVVVWLVTNPGRLRPVDRLIAAQAMRRGYQFVSADRVFRSLDGLLLLSA